MTGGPRADNAGFGRAVHSASHILPHYSRSCPCGQQRLDGWSRRIVWPPSRRHAVGRPLVGERASEQAGLKKNSVIHVIAQTQSLASSHQYSDTYPVIPGSPCRSCRQTGAVTENATLQDVACRSRCDTQEVEPLARLGDRDGAPEFGDRHACACGTRRLRCLSRCFRTTT